MLDAHDLPNDVDHLKRLVLEQRSHAQAQQLEIERLKIQLSRLRRWKFGRSSEQMELQIAQIELTLEALQAVTPARPPESPPRAAADAKARSNPKPRHPVRRALPAHLPRETIVHVAPCVRNGCTCADCGGKLRKLDQDVAEMLEFVPGYFKVIRHVREKHSCARCSTIVQAPAPSRPIERGLPGPGLLAHLSAGKYCYHQPLYRQSEVYGYAGVPIDRSTLTHWVGAASRLVRPLVEAVRRYVLGGRQLHADDTPLPVLDPGRGRTKTGYLWTYVRDERPWGSSAAPAVWFEYSPNRKGEHPRRHLRDFLGVVHSDAYSGLNELFECFVTNRRGKRVKTRAGPTRIMRALCWSHARRKLYDLYVALDSPIAREGVDRIDELFGIEREVRGLPPEERRRERQARAMPLLEALYTWLMSKLAQLPKKSELAKAIRYAVKPAHWPALMYYCSDGHVEMDNNAAERSLRTVALGRKSYLFAGSDAGGERAAAMYSLIGSCKLNKLDPESYLRYVFERIADHPINRIDELLPWNVVLAAPLPVSQAA
ncbi:MAG: IS66 family transposase [Steroidobacteraceae bacterium]